MKNLFIVLCLLIGCYSDDKEDNVQKISKEQNSEESIVEIQCQENGKYRCCNNNIELNTSINGWVVIKECGTKTCIVKNPVFINYYNNYICQE